MAFTYDADGNVTGDGAATWEYNEFNKLVLATEGGVSTRFNYDGRTRKPPLVRPGRSDEDDVVGRERAAPVATSVSGAGSDTDYRYDSSVHLWLRSNGVEAGLFTDALGSVKQAFIGYGNTAWSSGYEPFGTPKDTVQEELSTVRVGFGFTGAYADPAVGLPHLRLRDYDPGVGRLIVDPIDPPVGVPAVSPYAYVDNQPTLLTGPSGACPWDWCVDLIASATGAYFSEGAPSHGELTAGFGAGLLQAGESAFHGLLAGSNPAGPNDLFGWEGTWFSGKFDPHNHGWFQTAAIAGEVGLEAGLAVVGGTFSIVRTAMAVNARFCPPGLTSRVSGPTFFAGSPPKTLSNVDEVLAGLPMGKRHWVRTVPDEKTLYMMFDDLTRGGTPIRWPNFDGTAVKRPDGIHIGIRHNSRSGGSASTSGFLMANAFEYIRSDCMERTLRESLLLDGLDDWTDAVWVYQVAGLSNLKDPDLLRTLAIGIIAELLVEGLVVAGDVDEGGHRPWACTTGEAIERITREWLHDWRDEVPTPGAMVWLANTEIGDEMARAVLAREKGEI